MGKEEMSFEVLVVHGGVDVERYWHGDIENQFFGEKNTLEIIQDSRKGIKYSLWLGFGTMNNPGQ